MRHPLNGRTAVPGLGKGKLQRGVAWRTNGGIHRQESTHLARRILHRRAAVSEDEETGILERTRFPEIAGRTVPLIDAGAGLSVRRRSLAGLPGGPGHSHSIVAGGLLVMS